MNKRMRGRTRAADHRKTHLAAMLLFMFTLAALIAAALIRPAMRTDKPDGDELTNIEIVLDHVDADEGVSRRVLLELMKADTDKSTGIGLSTEGPTVLIYHTHTTEAYFPTKRYTYAVSSPWRTKDNGMNVVAVGERLCTLLNERYGIYAIHDITDHEPPKLSSAYSRSLETMLEYKKKYPTIELFIDLHRDAYGNDPKAPADYLVIDGKECARIMFVVGTGEGATGAGFDEMPDFQSNYALAKGISEYLGTIHKNLARNIRVKVGRYNQHVSSHCLLAEIGHNANTFEQAMNSVEFLAEAIANAASAPASAQVEEEEALPTMLQLTP